MTADDARQALRLAAARLAVGVQAPEDLSMLAAEALAAGLDSPALREAAGFSRAEFHDARDHFTDALEELELEVSDEQEALWLLVRHKAAQVVAREVSPIDGARWIASTSHSMEREGDLRIFVGLASEWDDYAAGRPQIERRIVDEAAALLEQPQLHRWVKVQARDGCWPLWVPSHNRNFGRDELPLSSDLRIAIASWAEEFDRVQADRGPGPSGFPAQADAERFVERGRDLVADIQAELGDEWHVEYMQTASAFPPSRHAER